MDLIQRKQIDVCQLALVGLDVSHGLPVPSLCVLDGRLRAHFSVRNHLKFSGTQELMFYYF